MQFYFIRHAQSSNNVLWDLTGSSVGRSEDPEISPLGHQQARLLARFIARTEPTTSATHMDAGDQPPGLSSPSPTSELAQNERAQNEPAHSEPLHNKRDFYNHRGFALTHLYTSLMLRAVQTGEPLARALNLPLIAWPDLHETGGIYLESEDPAQPGSEPLRTGLPGKPRSYFEKHFPCLQLPADLDESGWWNRPFEERPQRFLRARRFIDVLISRHGGTQDRVAVISHGAFYNYLIHALLDIQFDEQGEFRQWFTMNNCAISRFDFLEGERSIVYMNRADFLPADLIT